MLYTNLPARGRQKLSRLAYVAYQLAFRRPKKNRFNPIHYGGKLFQQWLVDQYCRIEKDRIEFIKVYY